MKRLRELREDRDLKQIDVSLATGIDQRTLSNYETGKTRPDSFAIVKLARFFNVSTDYLLEYPSQKSLPADELLIKVENIQKELDTLKQLIKNNR